MLYHDSAVQLMADGELVDQACARAQAFREAADAGSAARVAAEAYTRVIDAGMQQAIEAFTRKLTTRCDFGVLATQNVKVLPLYWRTLEKLTAFFPPCRRPSSSPVGNSRKSGSPGNPRRILPGNTCIAAWPPMTPGSG